MIFKFKVLLDELFKKNVDYYYDWEKLIFSKISEQLPEKHKEIFDYQVNLYNHTPKIYDKGYTNLDNEFFYFYYKYGFQVMNYEKEFARSENIYKNKHLAKFILTINNEKIIGFANVSSGRFSPLSFNKKFDYKNVDINTCSVEILKIHPIQLNN